MGTDAADYDGSGRASLVVGNFSNEMIALYHNEGGGLFIDEAPANAIGPASLPTLTFACLFVDVDLDGRPGHPRRQRPRRRRHQPRPAEDQYAQPPHLFRNLGNKRFEPISDKVGPAFQKAGGRPRRRLRRSRRRRRSRPGR